MRYIVFDIEASKIPRHKPWVDGAFLCSIGMVTVDGIYKSWFFNPCAREHAAMLDEVQKEVDRCELMVGHNVKFDLNWLRWIGLKVDKPAKYCTMLGEYIYVGNNPDMSKSLDETASRHGLGHKLDEMAEYWSNGYETDEIPLEIHEKYLEQDVQLTRQLFELQWELIKQAKLLDIVYLSNVVLDMLSQIESRGINFDMKRALELVDEYTIKADAEISKMKEIVGVDFNPNSHAQLAAIMYGGSWKVDGVETYTVTLKSGTVRQKSRKVKVPVEYKGLGFIPPRTTESGKPATNKAALHELGGEKLKDNLTDLQIRFLESTLALSHHRKVVSTLLGSNDDTGLINKVMPDGKIHSNFNQTVTTTARLSSSDPNGQNFPRGNTSPIKEVFIPVYDKIVNLDLAQIEWRVAADLSRDEVMLDEIRHGVDIHSENAKQFFGANKETMSEKEFKALRTAAKVVSFRLLYGGSGRGFFMSPDMPDYTLEKWNKIVKDFYGKYKGLRKWNDESKKKAFLNTGWLRQPSGRVLTFPYVENYDGMYEPKGRAVCNYPVQSASADLLYVAMAEIKELLESQNLKSRIILLVHDSIVFDSPADEVDIICNGVMSIFNNLPSLVRKYFPSWEMVVPLTGDCEVGDTYGSIVEYTPAA